MCELLEMLVFRFLLVLALCLAFAGAEEITYPKAHDYNYNANILYDSTGNTTDSFLIRPGFNFSFAGKLYDQCWFHKNARLSFDIASNFEFEFHDGRLDKGQTNPQEWIKINPYFFYLSGRRLLVRSTADNFTIDYSAIEFNSNVRWIITYYRNETNEVFDVETFQTDYKNS